MYMHLHMHACRTQRYNNKDERYSSLKKIYLSLFERVVCERELEIEQNCNILIPTLMATSVYFPFSWAAQPVAWGPASLDAVFFFFTASYLQLVWSPTAQSGAWGLPLLGAGFLYPILSPTGSISKLIEFPVHSVI